MAVIWIAGCETANQLWEFESVNGDSTRETSVVKTGNASLKITTSGNNTRSPSGLNLSTGYLRFYFRITTIPGTSAFMVMEQGGTPLCSVAMVSGGKMQLQHGTIQQQSTNTFSANTWHRVEVRYTAGTGSNGIATLRVNGTQEANITNGDATGSIGYIDFKGTGSATYFDDIVLRDDAFPADGGIIALRPNAAGDETGFSGTFADWDDDPISEATVRSSDTDNTNVLDNLTTTTVGTINFIAVTGWCKRGNGAVTDHFLRSKKSGGTAENSAALSLGTDFSYQTFFPPTIPANQSELDSWQAGAARGVGKRVFDIAELFVMVDAVQGGGIQSGAGSSAGVGTATGVGRSRFAAAMAAAGLATVLATGIATAEATASAAGAATASGSGARVIAASGSSAGAGTATATGISTFAVDGSAAGVGAVSGVGRSTAQSDAASAGAGTATATGAPISAADAASAGAATATAASASVQAGDGTSAGVGTASGVGRSTAESTAASAGVGAAAGTGRSTFAAAGSAAGIASATAVGFSPGEVRVQRKRVDFGASADTFNSTINAVSATANAFARLTNVLFSPGGRSAGTSIDVNSDDLSGTCLLTSTTNVQLTRRAAAEDVDYRFDYEVWEYDGPASGANEFIVRYHNNVTLSNGTATVNQAVSGITDINKCVPFLCGTSSDRTQQRHNDVVVTLEMVTGPNAVKLTRRDSNGQVICSIAVLEFTGSNWQVQNNVSHTIGSPDTTETKTISDVGDWSTAFIVVTKRPAANSFGSDDDMCCLVWPGATTTQLRLRSEGLAGGVIISHIVKHADLTVFHNDSITGSLSDLPDGADPSINNRMLAGSVASLDTSGLICTANSTQTSTDYPNPHINYRLTSVNNVEFWQSRSTATAEITLQAIDFTEVKSQGSIASGTGVGAATGVGRATFAGAAASAGAGTATAVGDATVAGDAAAAGAGTATGVGISTAAADGTAAGTGTASAVGESTAAADGSAAGVATVSGTGAATSASDASAAGAGTATATGAPIAAADASAAGTSTASAVSQLGSVASAAGVGAASGTGAATAASTASAAGTATATGSSEAVAEGVGSSAGLGAVSGVGRATAASAADSAGAATVTATGSPVAAGDGSAAGAGTATATAIATASTTATAAGTATVTGDGEALGGSTASSAGVATANSVGAATATSDGSSAGLGAANAKGAAIAAATGDSAGTGTASATGTAISEGVGSAAGAATVTATGATVLPGAASSAGQSAVAAVGQATAEANGAASGAGTASGQAAAIAAGVAAGAGTSTATATSIIATAGAGLAAGAAVVLGHSPVPFSLKAERRGSVADDARRLVNGAGRKSGHKVLSGSNLMT